MSEIFQTKNVLKTFFIHTRAEGIYCQQNCNTGNVKGSLLGRKKMLTHRQKSGYTERNEGYLKWKIYD